MSIQAMKQALAALNTCRIMGVDEDETYTREITPKVITSAINALQQAIEQAEKPLIDSQIDLAIDTWFSPATEYNHSHRTRMRNAIEAVLTRREQNE